MTMPADWFWIALGAIGLFIAQQIWPAVRGWTDAGLKARLAREARDEDEQEDRFLKAFETSSAAQAQTASALEKVAASLDLFARNSVAVTFELSELRREVRGRRPAEDTDRDTIARMLGQEPKA